MAIVWKPIRSKELVEADIPNTELPVRSNVGCVRRMNKYIRVRMVSEGNTVQLYSFEIGGSDVVNTEFCVG